MVSQLVQISPSHTIQRSHPAPPFLLMAELEHTVFSTSDITEHHGLTLQASIFISGRPCGGGLSCLLEAVEQD